MIFYVEAACLIYVVGCLLAVGLDAWMHRAFRSKDERRQT